MISDIRGIVSAIRSDVERYRISEKREEISAIR
jgi:hypothetical protein